MKAPISGLSRSSTSAIRMPARATSRPSRAATTRGCSLGAAPSRRVFLPSGAALRPVSARNASCAPERLPPLRGARLRSPSHPPLRAVPLLAKPDLPAPGARHRASAPRCLQFAPGPPPGQRPRRPRPNKRRALRRRSTRRRAAICAASRGLRHRRGRVGARLPRQPNGHPDLDLCLAEPTVLGEAIGCVAQAQRWGRPVSGRWRHEVAHRWPHAAPRGPQFGTQRSSRLEGVAQRPGMCRCNAARQDGGQYQPDQHWNPFRVAPVAWVCPSDANGSFPDHDKTLQREAWPLTAARENDAAPDGMREAPGLCGGKTGGGRGKSSPLTCLGSLARAPGLNRLTLPTSEG